ncbi:hypothetical protein [Novosphingobium aquimarinum]|uniref:hypothetical protein n=1 Tax=Novosphingobium aquimarinum TaxID=2682494 RepID=UPI0012EC1E46|nr:hypothetical protein [Novosphingobium aquimarinum]
MLAEATIGDLGERDFLREIEELLRNDRTDEALDRISEPMARHCRPGGVLPEALIDLNVADIVIGGWDALEPRMRQIDREGYPVTALGIEITEPAPGSEPGYHPLIETCFYTDSAYPFSECDREALLEGYSSYGTEWQGSCDDCDATITVRGLHEPYAAVAALGGRIRDPERTASEGEIQAYMLGASYLAVLVHAAVRKAVDEKGLPRPLAIFVAGNGSYPGFDAPIATHFDVVGAEPPRSTSTDPAAFRLDDRKQNETIEDAAPTDGDDTLDFEPQPDEAMLDLGNADDAHPDEFYELPATMGHVSGSQLRKRFVTDESIALTQESEPESLIQRLLGKIKPRS